VGYASLDELNVVPHRVLVILVYALPVLVVSLAVLMGGHALLNAANESPAIGSTVFLWVGISCLIFLIIDIVLLVGALGINAIAAGNEQSENSS